MEERGVVMKKAELLRLKNKLNADGLFLLTAGGNNARCEGMPLCVLISEFCKKPPMMIPLYACMHGRPFKKYRFYRKG